MAISGYVGTDGNFVETDKASTENADVLWGLDSSSGKPAIVFARTSKSPDTKFLPRQKALAMSPVFVLPTDRAEVVTAALKSADVSEDHFETYSRDLPPVFAPAISGSPIKMP